MDYLARDIMNRDVISVPADMDLRDLGKLFLEKGITGAPVVERDGTLAGVVDATITVTLLDGGGFPVVNFAFEDLWLESSDGGMVFCIGGTTADANTDGAGMTAWTLPLAAGGASQSVTLVTVNGAALTSNAGLALSYNSADLNGDQIVNLTDVPEFAGDFFGGTE